jgi:hypothetical protein
MKLRTVKKRNVVGPEMALGREFLPARDLETTNVTAIKPSKGTQPSIAAEERNHARMRRSRKTAPPRSKTFSNVLFKKNPISPIISTRGWFDPNSEVVSAGKRPFSINRINKRFLIRREKHA